MSRALRNRLACAAIGLGLLGAASTAAVGQIIERERDTKVTGPRGRTIERDIKVERGPGFIDRQVEIKRPGETIIRDTRVQVGPGGGRGFGPGYGGPRYYGGYGGPRFVENVIVQRPPVYAGFIGLPALSFFFGGAPSPPIVVVPPPPVLFAPPPPPQAFPAFDPFADALGRLKSYHGSSRRDGALTLGRIGDARAIPALNERLEHDFDRDVRVAAAHALGEIGDERGAVALDKAVLYDKRHEVRDSARAALAKIPKPGEVQVQTLDPDPTRGPVPAPSPIRSRVVAPLPGRRDDVDPGPNPSSSSTPTADDQPPPPPVPYGSPALEPPRTTSPPRDPS